MVFDKSDHQIGAWTLIMDSVKTGIIQKLAVGFQLEVVLFPGCHGVRLVDAGCHEDVIPQLLHCFFF